MPEPTTTTTISHESGPSPQTTITTNELTKMSAVERSRILRVARMEPHLQVHGTIHRRRRWLTSPILVHVWAAAKVSPLFIPLSHSSHTGADSTPLMSMEYGTAQHLSWVREFTFVSEHTHWDYPSAADAGSIYEPLPSLTYEWDPDRSMPDTFSSFTTPNGTLSASSPPTRDRANSTATSMFRNGSASGSPVQTMPSFELGPHPADPHSTVMPTSPSGTAFAVQSSNSSGSVAGYPFVGANGLLGGNASGVNACKEKVPGQEIWVYGGAGGTFTFWRFLIRVPLAQREMVVTYSINGGQKLAFHVPGRGDNMRLAIHSVSSYRTSSLRLVGWRSISFSATGFPLVSIKMTLGDQASNQVMTLSGWTCSPNMPNNLSMLSWVGVISCTAIGL